MLSNYDYPLTSSELSKVHEKQDQLKLMIELGVQPMIREMTFTLAKLYFGGKTTELIKYLLQDSRAWREICERKLTPEEIAEFENLEREDEEKIREAATEPLADEIEIYRQPLELAKWLFREAELGEKDFDETFEQIMRARYDEVTVHCENNERFVRAKVKRHEDRDDVLI